MRRERVCAIELCRGPQYGDTPLHTAAKNGHAAVVEKLLTAEAAKEATNRVRGKGDTGTQSRRSRGAIRTSACHLCLRSGEKFQLTPLHASNLQSAPVYWKIALKLYLRDSEFAPSGKVMPPPDLSTFPTVFLGFLFDACLSSLVRGLFELQIDLGYLVPLREFLSGACSSANFLGRTKRNMYAHCLAWVFSFRASLLGCASVEVLDRGGRG